MSIMQRVKYFSKSDLSSGFNLLQAEKVIQAFSASSVEQSVNDILEYVNIIKYFDNKLFLKNWDDSILNKYSSIVKEFKPVIGRFMSTIKADTLSSTYEQVDKLYKDDFFETLEKYNVTNRISNEEFVSFLKKDPAALKYILYNKKTVDQFGLAIANMLEDNICYAEIVISHYFEDKSAIRVRKTFMPAELVNSKLNNILRSYVGWENANPNYLELIAGLKKAGEHSVDVHIRYKAHLRVLDFWKQIKPEKHKGIKYGADIRFIKQDKIKEEQIEPGSYLRKISYSKEWIANNLDYPTLLNNFIYLFEYVDEYICCQFLSKPNELGVIEQLTGIHGTSEYRIGIGYRSKDILSTLQMLAYKNELQNYKISIESLFKWFFENYLCTEFGVKGFNYITPSSSSKMIEKILLLTSQFDAVIKQFRLFIDEGEVNRGLFEFSSDISPIVDSASMIERKYIYPNSTDLKRVLFDFFSDQSLLGYTESTGDKYDYFTEILANDNVRLSDFPSYCIDELEWLQNKKMIFTDKSGFIRCDWCLAKLLFVLNENGCIAYSYCSAKEKDIIEELLNQKDVVSEQKLFTRQEQEYIDYMLNVHTFVNGPELRNRYVHGNCSLNTKIHQNDYLELLKLMTLIIIKINEEFCLKYPEKTPEH